MASPTIGARSILVADGWRKRSGDCYTRRLVPGVLGLLALRPVRGLPHQWRLEPYVGLVHERVNGLAAALRGGAQESPYPQDTIRAPLVRLLDGPEAREGDRWLVAAQAPGNNERVFREVAEAAREVGLPWLHKRTGLDAIAYELRDGNGPWRRTPYLTAALWLQGEVDAAEAWLEEVTSQFGRPGPEIPEDLRGLRATSLGTSAPPEGWPRQAFDAFAARLRDGMARHPGGPPDDWHPPPGNSLASGPPRV
ncbi:MAG: hypothetical protein QOH37_3764 [Nocardioidaceae bacterium]|nr:hypothetical protein [Nocardioidaceae bacterium]